jgi:hypothetical protein
VTLLDSQRESVRRARHAIARFGGVLIADDVGAGKTYIALTLVSRYTNPIVLAPAVLRVMWEDAARRASVRIAFMSIESLPGCRKLPQGHDVVLIDEAHHLRNPATKRYAAALALVRRTDTVLLSATPIHNTAADLDAQLALFLGADARDLDDETRAMAIVRGMEGNRGPGVVVHPSLAIPDAPHILEVIQSLPAPVVPRDGGNAPTLVRMGFLRAWCSSSEATFAMLRRALRRAEALRDALAGGASLTRRDLQSWIGRGEDQLGFTGLLADPTAEPIDARSAHAYAAALRALWTPLVTLHWIDDERASHVRTIMNAHAGVPVLVCAQYAATIDAMWSRLRMLPGVAALTSKHARIASGPITRDQALARFAPRALGAAIPHERERIDLLLATDLVSEGLNLHDAGVLIHMDLPWTAARLAQRVGRIARMGSPHETVHTYSLSPPRAAAALLKLERRIEAKRRIAAELVGGARRVASLLGRNRGRAGEASPESYARIVHLLRPWTGGADERCGPLVCGVAAPKGGWLALCDDGDRARLVVRVGRAAPTTDPSVVMTAVEWLVGAEEQWLPATWGQMRTEVERWLERQRGRQLSDAFRTHAARFHGRELAVTMTAMSGALPHERARVAAGATTLHAGKRRHSPASLIALVIFCRGDESNKASRASLRP